MNNIVFDDVVIMLAPTITQDDIGNDVRTYTERQLFCGTKEISMNEAMRGRELGIHKQSCVIVNTVDYQNEETVKFHNDIYRIYRTYKSSNETIELYLELSNEKL